MARLRPFVTSAIRSLWDGKRTLKRKSFQLDANKQGANYAIDASRSVTTYPASSPARAK